MRLSHGATPAKLAQVLALLDPVEMMFALKQPAGPPAARRTRRTSPTKENPALLAADAAEAALRGFAEIETTVGVARYAPLNALAILVGAQTGRAAAS